MASASSVTSRRMRHKFNLADTPPSSHKGDLQTNTPSINEVRGWRWGAVWLLAFLVRCWGRTLRFKHDEQTRLDLDGYPEPTAVVLWHNRLFLTPEIFRRHRSKRRIYGLVSASKDGAWLAAFYRLIGIQPIRGSSSNFGREAARQLIEVMQQGHDVGITPDGPRGPIYTVEPGVLVVTRRNQAPMLLIGVEFGSAWRLKSWDRFYLPHPFSVVKLRTRMLPAKKADGSKLSAEEVRDALLAINPDLPVNENKNRGAQSLAV